MNIIIGRDKIMAVVDELKIKIINKIDNRIIMYQNKTGANKTWIAHRLGISRQRMYDLSKAENFNLDTLIKLSILLECDISELFDYEIISK